MSLVLLRDIKTFSGESYDGVSFDCGCRAGGPLPEKNSTILRYEMVNYDAYLGNKLDL